LPVGAERIREPGNGPFTLAKVTQDVIGVRCRELETLFVSYNRMIGDPAGQTSRVAGFLGGGLSAAAMAAAVDPSLYRQRGPLPQPQATPSP
jgi:hypothetical protein